MRRPAGHIATHAGGGELASCPNPSHASVAMHSVAAGRRAAHARALSDVAATRYRKSVTSEFASDPQKLVVFEDIILELKRDQGNVDGAIVRALDLFRGCPHFLVG